MPDRFPPLAPPEPQRPRTIAHIVPALPWAELGFLVLLGGLLMLA